MGMSDGDLGKGCDTSVLAGYVPLDVPRWVSSVMVGTSFRWRVTLWVPVRLKVTGWRVLPPTDIL